MSQDDKYTYPNSGGVLRNKRGFTDVRRLDRAMNDLASTAWALVSLEPDPEAFDFAYLQRIHSKMFDRLFDWAGRVRDVDTVAGNTSIVYARPAFIHQNLDDMFNGLARDEVILKTDDPAEFAVRLSSHWGFLSLIHPFRDGNTRSQSLFVSNLSRAAGHPIDWSRVAVEELRVARLRAMQGDERVLADLILRSITGEADTVIQAVPVFRVDVSNTSGVAAPSPEGRCGKPRLRGRGTCRRLVGEHGCPYHG